MLVMITNSIQPYSYDIVHVLGLPFNFRHRFRYRSKWINLSSPIESLQGKQALIVLRNRDNADLIPIRFVLIDGIRKVGDINYIDFRVQNYFPLSERKRVGSALSKELASQGCPNQPKANLNHLLIDAEARLDVEKLNATADDDQHSRWSDLLKVIGKLRCYKDLGFLRIVQLSSWDEEAASASRDQAGEYSYSLKPDRVYFLEVIQHTPWGIDKTESIDNPFDVILNAVSDEISVLRKAQRVVGKYDLLRFIFKTPAISEAKHTFLELESKQEYPGAKYRLPALFIPVKIEIPRKVVVIKRARKIVTAIAITAFVTSDPISSWLGAKPELIRDLALLFVVAAMEQWEQFAMGFVKKAEEIKVS